MATYFARKSGNINAADVWATTPSGVAGAVTFASGDVLVANNFTITVNVSTDLGGTGQLRNDATGGATAGGSFTLSDGVTLTANIYGGTAAIQCVTANPTTNQYIVGNVFGGSGNSTSAHGVLTQTNTGTLTITGNLTGGAGLAAGTTAVSNVSANLVVIGNVVGSSNTSFGTGEGIRLTGAGNCTVTGNVTGGSHATNYGVRVTGSGNITVVGQAIGGVAAPAINNESTGQVTVTRAVGNGFGGGSVGLSAAVGVSNVANQSSITIVEQIEFGTLGQSPVNGRIRLKKANTNVATFNFCDSAGAKTLIDATANAAMPAASNVRSGVSYASGALTGTCAVPAAGSVALGVPIDNTIGTAILTQANVQSALTAQGFTTDRAGNLDNLDATVSSRLAPSGTLATVTTLTNAPSVPSASAIASQVRSELSVELGRVDQNISSRLAAADYTAPSAAPSVTAIRQEMDANSTKLANLDASVSSRLAGASYTAPANSDITAIKVQTDALNTERLANVATTAIVGNLIAQANS